MPATIFSLKVLSAYLEWPAVIHRQIIKYSEVATQDRFDCNLYTTDTTKCILLIVKTFLGKKGLYI